MIGGTLIADKKKMRITWEASIQISVVPKKELDE